MKLFLLENKSPDMLGDRDIYVSAVVVAEDKQSAKKIFPSDFVKHIHVEGIGWCSATDKKKKIGLYSWPHDLKYVKVTELGDAKAKRVKVICSDFNGG